MKMNHCFSHPLTLREPDNLPRSSREENSIASAFVVLHSYRTSRRAFVSATFDSPCNLDQQGKRTSSVVSNEKHSHEKKSVGHRRRSGHSGSGRHPVVPIPLRYQPANPVHRTGTTGSSQANRRSNSSRSFGAQQHSPAVTIAGRCASDISRVVKPKKIFHHHTPCSRPATRRRTPRTDAAALSQPSCPGLRRISHLE